MKISRVEDIHVSADATDERRAVIEEVLTAARRISWPPGSGQFVVAPLEAAAKHPNGVKPIRTAFAVNLRDLGWQPEQTYKTELLSMHGALDAVRETPIGLVGVEWETGNISSSHRALNKLALGLYDRELSGGVLVVIDSAWKAYFTDRIGNSAELLHYYRVWQLALRGTDPAFLALVVVEPDAIVPGTPAVPKGKDGNSLARRIALGEVVL